MSGWIGVIEAEEGRRERNDRVLAAAAVSHLYAAIRSVDDLEARFIDNLVQFWTNKNAASCDASSLANSWP